MGIIRKIVKKAFKPTINNVKGAIGEQKVSAKLNPLFFGAVEHRQINDFVLMDEKGQSHQIDHIEIRENGIFCIETKNYSGWIFGSENQAQWTQTLYNEKYKFANPIKQNNSHIYHLSNVLENQYKINSVIVMVQNNANRISVPYVVNLNDLKSYLANFSDGTHYSVEEMDQIYQRILNSANQEITRKEHVQNIHNLQESINRNICPRCGSDLLLKKGTYGQFYGCSNYPNCRFTKKL